MNDGLFWTDNDPEKTLVDKICEAAVHYQAQFHRRPAICYVNEGDYLKDDPTLVAVNGIRVDFLPHIKRNQFWFADHVRDEPGAVWYEARWYQGQAVG